MQVDKIQLALAACRQFIERAENVLHQSDTATFLLANGEQAKRLRKLSMKVIQAMTEMRRP